MIKKYEISRLLDDLRNLYHKLFTIDLRKCMSLYHRHIGTNHTPDIATSLTEHLDKLAPTSKPSTVDAASAISITSSKRPESSAREKLPGKKVVEYSRQ